MPQIKMQTGHTIGNSFSASFVGISRAEFLALFAALQKRLNDRLSSGEFLCRITAAMNVSAQAGPDHGIEPAVRDCIGA
jgi:hypothetical protein